ncbi:MAG: GTP-sensing pleiotropic transcriptional regulator CodY [Clostridia bacterium]|jgi:transcriptional pleiotropic repressor
MAKNLLEKTRRLNRVLLNAGSEPVAFQDLSNIMKEILHANVYVVSRKGKILGYSLVQDFQCSRLEKQILENLQLPDDLNQKLLTIKETDANIVDDEKYAMDSEKDKLGSERNMTIVPVNGGGQRLGTLVFCRYDHPFGDEDLILAEYSATVVGMEIMRSKAEEIEEETRKKMVVQLALGTLSFSELKAVNCIMEELEGNEGLLVASKIADKVGITRSVIVNALRKLESAGAIESRSLGMKGTYIRILNDRLLEELENLDNGNI